MDGSPQDERDEQGKELAVGLGVALDVEPAVPKAVLGRVEAVLDRLLGAVGLQDLLILHLGARGEQHALVGHGHPLLEALRVLGVLESLAVPRLLDNEEWPVALSPALEARLRAVPALVQLGLLLNLPRHELVNSHLL